MSGKMLLNVQLVDVATVVANALDAVRAAADAKNIQLDTAVPQISMMADPNRLQQIVWNLLSNAIKFTPSGGSVRMAVRRVDDSLLELVVTDTGQGIASDLLPHVFERFRQADSTTTRRHAGLGLGLAIVRHLVELHGGSVRADSDGHGHGATFTVTLPIVAPSVLADKLLGRPAPARPEPIGAALAGLRVLVVDDEPATSESLALLLKQSGAEVHSASSAPEALTVMSEWTPDVLISDIGMPGQDGYTLIRRWRQRESESGTHVPAIALSAYVRADDRERALAHGFDAHVGKPVEPNVLTRIVAQLVGRIPHPPAA
jgi:CheY-like chemotaxis protein/two-component sensor histidine kinase